MPIASAHGIVARYPIVLLGAGHNRVAGEAFVGFVRSAAGQAILRQFGFAVP